MAFQNAKELKPALLESYRWAQLSHFFIAAGRLTALSATQLQRRSSRLVGLFAADCGQLEATWPAERKLEVGKKNEKKKKKAPLSS